VSGAGTRGRRAGGGDTRGAILSAARTSFAESGYAGTSIRAVASSAGVDSALVHHYFGTKDDLFLAALEMPVDPRVVLAGVAEGDLDGVAERLLRAFLGVWEDPQARLPLLALVRSGLAGEPGRTIVETALKRLVFGTLGQVLEIDEPERRMSLVASQMLGLIVARYLLLLEPLASMTPEEVTAWVAPTIQRYLTGPLP
jgi:AcrR family transcriptional regulator